MRAQRVSPRRLARRGFYAADAVLGLALVGVLSVAIVSVVRRERRAASELSDRRAAVHAAEATLSRLMAGAAREPGTNVNVAPAAGGGPITGYAWVEVRATVRGRSAVLVGLVPGTASIAQPAARTQPVKGVP